MDDKTYDAYRIVLEDLRIREANASKLVASIEQSYEKARARLGDMVPHLTERSALVYKEAGNEVFVNNIRLAKNLEEDAYAKSVEAQTFGTAIDVLSRVVLEGRFNETIR